MPRKRSPSCSPACRNSTAGILSSWCRMPARATARWRSLSGRLASPPSNCSPNGTAASMTPGTGPWLGRAVSGCSSWAATTASRTRTFWAKQRRCCGRWPPASALPQEAYACWTQGDNADFSPHRFWMVGRKGCGILRRRLFPAFLSARSWQQPTRSTLICGSARIMIFFVAHGRMRRPLPCPIWLPSCWKGGSPPAPKTSLPPPGRMPASPRGIFPASGRRAGPGCCARPVW